MQWQHNIINQHKNIIMSIQIRFRNIQFTDIDYKVISLNQAITIDPNTSLNIVPEFDGEHKKKFNIIFTMSLENNDFKLKLKAVAQFSTDQDIDEEFIQSPFVKINAPAIAFPYVRTFISNLTLNSGYNPIVLPAFNFVKLAENKDNQ